MSRTKRWLIVGLTVAVASFAQGLLSARTSQNADEIVPSEQSVD